MVRWSAWKSRSAWNRRQWVQAKNFCRCRPLCDVVARRTSLEPTKIDTWLDAALAWIIKSHFGLTFPAPKLDVSSFWVSSNMSLFFWAFSCICFCWYRIWCKAKEREKRDNKVFLLVAGKYFIQLLSCSQFIVNSSSASADRRALHSLADGFSITQRATSETSNASRPGEGSETAWSSDDTYRRSSHIAKINENDKTRERAGGNEIVTSCDSSQCRAQFTFRVIFTENHESLHYIFIARSSRRLRKKLRLRDKIVKLNGLENVRWAREWAIQVHSRVVYDFKHITVGMAKADSNDFIILERATWFGHFVTHRKPLRPCHDVKSTASWVINRKLSSRHRREKKRETLLAALGWLVCASTPNMGKELFELLLRAIWRKVIKLKPSRSKSTDHDIKFKFL